MTRYFVVLPAFTDLYRNIEYDYSSVVSKEVVSTYNSESEQPLSQQELTEFLVKGNLLSEAD